MRKLYIDNIRWITVVLVVLYHVIKKRTGKLLVPSTLGLLVFWWILGYYNLLISGGLEEMAAVPKPVLFIIMAVSGIGPLWYIQMLWIFSVLLIWVRRVEKDRLWKLGEKADVPFLVLFAIVIWGAAQILNTPMVVVYRFGIYGAGFFVGYFVLSHDEVMDRLEKCWLPLAVCAVIYSVILGQTIRRAFSFRHTAMQPVCMDRGYCSFGFHEKMGGYFQHIDKMDGSEIMGTLFIPLPFHCDDSILSDHVYKIAGSASLSFCGSSGICRCISGL